ncbi:uncharacterized protein [Prorops nasuta]
MFPENWLGGLFQNIQKMTKEIQEDVDKLTRGIGENVKQQVAEANKLAKNAVEAAGNGTANSISIGDGSSVIMRNSGLQTVITSGVTEDGKPFYRATQEKVQGHILDHYEKVYEPNGKTLNEYRYTLDLKDPTAKPVFVPIQH